MKTNYEKASALWQTLAAVKIKAEVLGDQELVKELDNVLKENRPALPIDEVIRLKSDKKY